MNFDDLLKSVNETSGNITTEKKTYEKDTRYWKPTLDEDKKSSAKIRFLYPVEEGMEKPYASFHKYGFSFSHGGKKRWYINKSRRNISPETLDPVYVLSGNLYKDDAELWKPYISKMGYNKALQRVANIRVISDPANPENNGKVFLYIIPKLVFAKIEEALEPQDEFTEKFNPFHPLEGADMIIKSFVGTNGITDYSNSNFQTPSPLEGGDKDKIMEILNQQHSLKEVMSTDDIPTYEELEKTLKWVCGDDVPARFFNKDMKAEPVIEKADDILTESKSETMDALPDSKPDEKVEKVEEDIDALLADLQEELG